MNESTWNQSATDAELVDSSSEADEKTVADLRARLAERASGEGIVDIAYRMLDTPVGTLLLAATDQGLVRVAYPWQGHDAVLDHLADRVSPRVLYSPGRLDPAAHELEEYFNGRRRTFDLTLDLQLVTPFRRRVLDALPTIGYGQTASYRQVAESVGNPRAVRAVGTACATNPLPLIVPCHRVVHSDGSIGSYAGGTEAKARLLDLETGYSAPPR